MQIRSLAFRTDLALLTQSGSLVEEHDDCVVVRTPDNPSFYWGNFLLLRDPPQAAEPWLARFEAEHPTARHRAFGLDVPDAEPSALAAFTAAGLCRGCLGSAHDHRHGRGPAGRGRGSTAGR